MAQCNVDYYGRHDSIGAAADFITAPEISQMFGELLGAWVIARWHAMDAPTPFQLIELGPGKGTLMADMLRVLRNHADIYAAVRIHLVETSPKLHATQKETLQDFTPPVTWHDNLQTVPPAPFILIANEFLDALPIQQFIYTLADWQERGVRRDGEKLTWATRDINNDALPDTRHLPAPVPGNILEHCPALPDILQSISTRLTVHSGAALLIDYGYARTDYGDTFQAVARHQYANPLENPGEQDLTAHVNFAVIENFGKIQGQKTPLKIWGHIGQGEFLINLGLQLRAEKLLANAATPEDKMEIIEAAHRLTHPSEMGSLFKVICLSSSDLPPPEGFK